MAVVPALNLVARWAIILMMPLKNVSNTSMVSGESLSINHTHKHQMQVFGSLIIEDVGTLNNAGEGNFGVIQSDGNVQIKGVDKVV
jgi:hypothetical protein